MKVAIHQPNYLPYLGFFDKMKRCDVFVIYDDAQFNKEDFQHRNRIRIYNGWKYLTVPVKKQPIPIKEIKIKSELKVKNITWQENHLKEIRHNYKDTPYYHLYEENFEAIYANKYDKLIDLNINLINFLKDAFKIKTKIIFASDLGYASRSNQRLIDIISELDGDEYLSGPKGHDYLDLSRFEDAGIKVEFQEFKHPIYKQRYEFFISNMSAIDALFNINDI